MKKPQHILIIRLSAMGDVAMTMPVVYAFAKANPEAKITFLSKAFFRPIVEVLPNIHFVAAKTNDVHKGIGGLWRLSRELKALGVTHVADLHNVLRSKILRTFLNLPSAAIDKGRAEKKALTRVKNKDFKQLKTTIQRYVDVFDGLGFKGIEPAVLSKPVSSDTVLLFTGLDEKRWIGVAPFAAHLGKQYPLDLMREVIEGLNKRVDIRLFLFGAPNEREQLLELAKDCDTCTIVAGVLKFPEELNLIAQLDGMLSMDSGNGHLAAMFGISTVTLWGVTHPYAGFAPFEQEAHCMVSDREQFPLIPTSVYGNKVPEGYEKVMRSIVPEKVEDKIKTVML
jgi:ADP-heptose:LPS heptosyltransferase